jgi:hypothetical protein
MNDTSRGFLSLPFDHRIIALIMKDENGAFSFSLARFSRAENPIIAI